MLDTVQKTIEQFHMLESGNGVVLGVSGGADSVCLFMILQELAEVMDLKLHVVHVNHLLRREADEEESYVREICNQYHVACHVFRKDIAAYAEELNCSVEEAGRIYRYDCFEEVCRQNHCDKIAVAHHENDRVETMLFHMVRGTGLRGIGSIPAVRGRIIRPLLYCSRQEIEAYLADKQIRFYNDASNASEEYTRNLIRHQVIPQLEKVNPQAVRHMTELSETAQEYWEYVEREARKAQQECVSRVAQGMEWKKEQMQEFPRVLQRHIVYRVLTEVSGSAKDWEQFHVEQVLDLQNKSVGKRVNLPYKLEAIRSYDGVRIQKELADENEQEPFIDNGLVQSVEITINGVTVIPQVGRVECHVSEWTGEDEISKKLYTKMMDYDKIYGTLCIRNPKPGDYFIINQEGERKKLSRLFIDKKVPKEQREKQLVLAAGQQVYWIIGMRISEDVKVDVSTKRVLEITFQYEKEYEGEYNG